MTNIIDKRKHGSDPASSNRKKLIGRCKDSLRKIVHDILEKEDLGDILKDREVTVPSTSLDEPTFENDHTTGAPHSVQQGNDEYESGDIIYIPGQDGQAGKEASDEMGEFSFVLEKKEFLDIIFEEMGLPDFIKESLARDAKYTYERAGTGTDGPITQLNLLKTMLTAMGRRFSAQSKQSEDGDEGKKIPFITEEDLRFNLYEPRPLPIRKAVMFAVMDYSGSMGDFERNLGKRFFFLLYLFLTREYEEMEIRFIIHDTHAYEVSEDQFFSAHGGGGTIVKSAMELVNKIILKEYDLTATNVYLAQVSDGDDWQEEAELCGFITETLLPKLQYFAYLQVVNPAWALMGLLSTKTTVSDLGGLYRSYKRNILPNHKNMNIGVASALTEVFPVLQRLFKKGK